VRGKWHLLYRGGVDEGNIKMDLQETGWDLARYVDNWRAVVNTVMNLRVL
jgi:hypothetical protein